MQIEKGINGLWLCSFDESCFSLSAVGLEPWLLVSLSFHIHRDIAYIYRFYYLEIRRFPYLAER